VLSSTTGESRLDEVDIPSGRTRKLGTYGPSVVFGTPSGITFAAPLSPDRKNLTTTAAVEKRDLWMLEGFPAPETLW